MKNPRGRPRSKQVDLSMTGRTMADHAIDVMEAVSSFGPISLRDLTTKMKVPASTAHRFLLILEARGFLSMDPVSQKWEIGVRAFQVGNAYLRCTGLAEMARAYLATIGAASGETANLSIRQGDRMIVIAQVESHNPLRAFFRLGSQIPIYCSAAGKAVLAHLRDDEVDAMFEKTVLARLTDRTIVSLPFLRMQLNEIRARGWALDDEEQVAGMRCVAAPIMDKDGLPVAALSLTGPKSRFDASSLKGLSVLVIDAARGVSDAIRGR
ncbi:hypothetical protein ATY78_03790 [Rhizobium sp. R635]|nr:hypothetical protein ATY78_03790 [Rhizobium sp. R635]